MGRRAQLILRVGTEGVEKVGQELDALKERANKLFSKLPKDLQRDLKKGWAAVKDSAQDALITTAKSSALAISGPARTTFDQALREANKFRGEVTRISVATGQSFDQVSSRVNATSRRIGELPQTVMDVSRALRASTGDWNTATDLIESFADRAAQTDRPLSAMTDAGSRLVEQFGTKSRSQVDSFFGTIDAQARKAGVAIGLTERLFFSFSDQFGRFSTAAPEKWAGLVTAFQKGQTPAQAERNLGFGLGFVNSNVRGIEQRMRASGELKKGQYLTDDNGEMSPENMLRALRYAQRDVVKYHGSKRKAIEIEAGEDAGARREVAGLLNTDLGRAGDKVTPEQRRALEQWKATAAGRRQGSEVEKNIKDQEFGQRLIGAQDAMVARGGGAAGIAMEAATGVFGTAVDRFGNAVMLFAGSSALGGGGGLGGVMGAARMGLVGAAGYLGYKGGEWVDNKLGISDKVSAAAYKMVPAVADWMAGPAAVSKGNSGHAAMVAENAAAIAMNNAMSPMGGMGGVPGGLDHRALGRAIADETGQKVLKVQIIQPPTGGAGQPFPG